MLGRCNSVSRKDQATVLLEHRNMSVPRAVCGVTPTTAWLKAGAALQQLSEVDCPGRGSRRQGGPARVCIYQRSSNQNQVKAETDEKCSPAVQLRSIPSLPGVLPQQGCEMERGSGSLSPQCQILSPEWIMQEKRETVSPEGS